MGSVEISPTMGPRKNTDSLFLVQDPDAPYYILAKSYSEAIDKWKRRIVSESEGVASLLDPELIPSGVALVAAPHEVIR